MTGVSTGAFCGRARLSKAHMIDINNLYVGG